MTIPYADLHNVPEDKRIELIGEQVRKGQLVGILLERHEPEKIKRYIKKIEERFPDVMLVEKVNGPTPLVVTLKFNLRPQH